MKIFKRNIYKYSSFDGTKENNKFDNEQIATDYIRSSQLRENGITLTSLVVTIIILLILSGVTISFVLDDNGIIKQSKLAIEKYKDSAQQEKSTISQLLKDMQDSGSSSDSSSSGQGGGVPDDYDEIKQENEELKNKNEELKVKQATGNAKPYQVLADATFSNSSGPQTGTMVNHDGTTNASSWKRNDDGTTFVNFPIGAYITPAGNLTNLPRLLIADSLYSKSEYDARYKEGYEVGYNKGYSDGTSKSYSGSATGTLTYKIGHHHTGSSQGGDGCYGKAVTTTKMVRQSYSGTYGCYVTREGLSDGSVYDFVHNYSWTCPYCGQKYGTDTVDRWGAYTASGSSHGVTHTHDVPTTVIDHYELNCGRQEGEQVRTVTLNISSTSGPTLASNEKINSVETNVTVSM